MSYSFRATRDYEERISGIFFECKSYVSNVFFFSTASFVYARFFRQDKKKDTSEYLELFDIDSESVNCRIAQKCDIGDSGVEDSFYAGSERVNKQSQAFFLRSSAHRRRAER